MPPPPILSHGPAPVPSSREVDGDRGIRVVLAPNAFKGTLTAAAAAEAMADGVHRVLPEAQCVLVPVADGGDGSLAAFLAAGYSALAVQSRGPTGEPVDALIAVRGGTAVVELAATCGMALLPAGTTAPLTSTTLGLGDGLRAALDAGVGRIVVCLGGSASTDGGTGMLTALGAGLLDTHGRDVPPGGARLRDIASLDLSGLDPRLQDVELVVAADVSSPLAGPDGAAHVFAAQKGATPDQVVLLDAGLASWGRVLAQATGRSVAEVPGSGAAGGTGAALLALGAHMRTGFDEIADVVGLARHLAEADLVITGEGRLDEQSALGKGALGVAALAQAAGVPSIAVCGRIALSRERLGQFGFVAWSDADAHAYPALSPTDVVADAVATVLRGWLVRR